MNIDDIAARLEALGNPTRLHLFQTLVRAGEAGLPVGKVQERLGIAASTLTHHLQKLILVGLVTQERRSTVLVCRANYAMMREVAGALVDQCCIDEAMEAPACSAACTKPETGRQS